MRLKELARINNLKIEEVGAITGASRSTAAKWMAGTTSPRISEAQKLADHFKVTLGDLLCIKGTNLNREQVIVLGFLETIGFEEMQRRVLGAGGTNGHTIVGSDPRVNLEEMKRLEDLSGAQEKSDTRRSGAS